MAAAAAAGPPMTQPGLHRGAASHQTEPQVQQLQQLCPDPSVHLQSEKNKALQGHAASAALYATHPDRDSTQADIHTLGPDGKPLPASRATTLKNARSQDLSAVGIAKDSPAHSAANLAHGNPKSFEWWQPKASEAAGKAALLANDYKMAQLWQPEVSAAASKASALAQSAAERDWWQPQASKVGGAAARLAVMNKSLSPQIDYGYTDAGRKNALLAASTSVKRTRAESTPPMPTQNLTAEPVIDDPALEAARIQHMATGTMPRSLFTEHPPVSPVLEERRHQDALKASALSFANQLYKVERVDSQGNVKVDADRAAADRVAATKASSTAPGAPTLADIRQQALQYLTLQDAAQRLAAERLAKIQTDQEARAFRDYWGYPSRKPGGNKLTVKRLARKRASSDSAVAAAAAPATTPTARGPRDPGFFDIDSDEEQDKAAAWRVRNQMSMLNQSMAAVDAKRRSQDRKALLAAAEKKVQESMRAMDEKLFNETGKMSAAMVEEWDAKARERAKAGSDQRMQNFGKVDVGGGKFLDQSVIDEIARQRVQPTLDRVTTEAEKQRARDEERRLDLDEKRRSTRLEKERQMEVRAESKKLREEEKKARQEERNASKAAKEAKKAERAEEKRLQKDVKRKSKEARKLESATSPKEDRPGTADTVTTAATATTVPEIIVDSDQEREPVNETTVPVTDLTVARNASVDSDAAPAPESPESPKTSPASKPSRLSRIIPHSIKRETDEPKPPTSPDTPSPPSKRDSSGIKTLFGRLNRRSKNTEPGSFRSGALAIGPPLSPRHIGADADSDSSLLSSDDELEVAEVRRVGVGAGRADDDVEEARDTFDERLAPPLSFGTEGNAKTGSPVREARFHEEL